MGTLVNNEDRDEMQHTCNVAFHQGLFIIQTKEYDIFENDNLTHQDMYNGLSQVYYIKPQRIHLVYKGLRSLPSSTAGRVIC